MKKINYWIILVLLVYGFIELFSYGGLLFLGKFRNLEYEPVDTISARHQKIINGLIDQKSNYFIFSPTLGWSIKKNGSSGFYLANSAAIRSDREYAIAPPRGVLRISTFGDSFTHCSDVKNNETWQAVMESYDSNMEVLNFGVGGYGLDQAYLRYLEDGRQYQSNIILIGYMSENIMRNVNTYRPFYIPDTGFPLTKPRFMVKNGVLSLIPNPINSLHDYKMLLVHSRDTLSRIGANDYYFKRRYSSNAFDWSPTVKLVTLLIQGFDRKSADENIYINGQYNENSEAFKVTKKIFDEFYNTSITNKSMPIILVFPNRDDITQYRMGNLKSYSPLLRYFDSVGYKYIDLMGAFDDAAIEDLFAEHYSPHYSPVANKLAAKYIFDYINNMSKEAN